MSTLNRFAQGQNKDNTGRLITLDTQTPAFASTLNVVATKNKTTVIPAVLTGATTINVGVGNVVADDNPPFAGDDLDFLFTSDATGRTVTFGTGLAVTAATLVLGGSKFGSIKFKFTGAVWVEVSRSVTV